MDTAVIVYEYLLTIHMESKVIWGRQLTIPTVLYFLNRYALVLFAIAVSLWAFVPWQSPTVGVAMGLKKLLIHSLPYSLFCTTHTCYKQPQLAMYDRHIMPWIGRSPTISGRHSIGTPTLGNTSSSEWMCSDSLVIGGPGCTRLVPFCLTVNRKLIHSVEIASEISTILMDVLVLAITWYRTAGIVVLARKAHLTASLPKQMLQDGTTFFSLTLCLHIIVIVVDETRQTSLVLITTTSDMESKLQSLHLTRFTSVRFASAAFDNLGAPLDVNGENEGNGGHNLHDDDDDDDDTDSLHQELIPRRGQNQLGEYASVVDMELIEQEEEA
ncbi:hypothetical protein C2E23DRAFT_857247 [Lenzites betulinus]|nr:hypothetical protein C2E23DRAFT_857247 [Lenzites betulinus]